MLSKTHSGRIQNAFKTHSGEEIKQGSNNYVSSLKGLLK
jgi:hypothetical protein